MPQEHYVLRCFSCETFQAHIVKKTKKWECKMCGAKQSLKRNYGKGSAKDCRNQVMRLNELRFINDSKANEVNEDIYEEDDLKLEQVNEELKRNRTFVSKWTEYLEEPEANTESEVKEKEPDFCTMVEKKSKKRGRKVFENSNKKLCISSFISEESSPVKSHSSPSFMYEKTAKTNTIQTVTKLTVSKYAKYLDNEEENDLTKVNKSSNIFDSGTNDLDNVLRLVGEGSVAPQDPLLIYFTYFSIDTGGIIGTSV